MLLYFKFIANEDIFQPLIRVVNERESTRIPWKFFQPNQVGSSKGIRFFRLKFWIIIIIVLSSKFICRSFELYKFTHIIPEVVKVVQTRINSRNFKTFYIAWKESQTVYQIFLSRERNRANRPVNRLLGNLLQRATDPEVLVTLCASGE